MPGEKRPGGVLHEASGAEEAGEVSAQGLRSMLRVKLPEYMVPAAFVRLEAVAADGEREAGPEGTAGAGRGSVCAARIRGAAGRDGGDAWRGSGRSCWEWSGSDARSLLRVRRPLAAGRAVDRAAASVWACTWRCAPFRYSGAVAQLASSFEPSIMKYPFRRM